MSVVSSPALPGSLLAGCASHWCLRVASRSARLRQRSLIAREWMDVVSLRLKWRRLRPGGASERSPAICAGCFSLMPRRRSSKDSPSCRTRVSLKGSVWAARGRVAIHDVRAMRADVGRCGRPNPPVVNCRDTFFPSPSRRPLLVFAEHGRQLQNHDRSALWARF